MWGEATVEARVYISHAQENENWLRETIAPGQENSACLIKRWQRTLQVQGWGGDRKAIFWYDREQAPDLRGGELWKKGILGEIDRAHVAVLLVTPAYTASPFLCDTEVPRILQRHAAGELELVPILVEPTGYAQLGIEASLFTPGKPTPLSELLAESEVAEKNAHLEITQALVWALERALEKAKNARPNAAPQAPSPGPRSAPQPAAPTQTKHPRGRSIFRRWPFWLGLVGVSLGFAIPLLVGGPSDAPSETPPALSKKPIAAAPTALPSTPVPIPQPAAIPDAAPAEAKRLFSADASTRLVGSGVAFAVAFSSGGDRVAGLFAASRPEIATWDLENRRQVSQCHLPRASAGAAAFSPNGKQAAVVDLAGQRKQRIGVGLFEVSTCKEILHLDSTTDVRWVGYAPSGDAVYLAGRRFVERWDLDQGSMTGRQEFPGLLDSGNPIAASGRRVVLLSSSPPSLQAWTTDLTREVWRHEESPGFQTLSLAVSPNGKLLLAGQNGRVDLHETASGRTVGQLTCPSGAFHAVAFSPDGSLIAAGGDDFSVCLWNTEKRQLLGVSKTARLDVRELAFSPDGRKIAVIADQLFVFDVPR
jgi:hypothetical protein